MHFLQSTEAFELQALKDSILTNGYVPLEQIVVEEYDEDENGQRYLVIEGNRRVAAIKSLLDEFRNAVITIPEDKLATMIALPAFVLGGSEDARASLRQTLMAIRHVAGIREWEPYQQAELIAELYEQEEHQFSRVAQRIGIKAREVGRRCRAIKALKQMENDEEFGEHATPKLYAFFHEAVSIPPIKEWLG
jgi:DNA-binding SARP family transcriptional activator